MSDNHETVADIVAEMRADIPRVIDARIILRNYADRIEAAHAREVQDALDTGGYVEACRARKYVGNAAKLRSALEHIAAIPMPPPNEMAQGIAVEMREVAIAALAAPPRNCDVGTAEEQTKRMQKEYCERCECYVMPSDAEPYGCPLYETGVDCRLKWAQMPYEESSFAKATEDKGGAK